MPAGEAPSWEELPSEEGEGMGRGGGVEEQPEASPVTEPEQPEEPEESVTLGADSVGTPTVESMPAPQEEETEIPMVEAAPTSSPSPEQVEEKLVSETTPTPTLEPVRVLEPERPAPVSEPESEVAFWQWLTVLLGVSTLVLGGAALWLSRYR